MIARCCGLLVLCGLLGGCAARQPSLPTAGGDVARQILITAAQPQSPALALAGDPVTTYQWRRGYGPGLEVDRLFDLIAREYGLARVDGWPIASLGIYCEVYALAPGQDADEVLARIRADARIESAQTMNVFRTQAVRYDDPLVSMQPALSAMSLDAAHEGATGKGVTVAVIDSLVDSRHPEMRGRVAARRNLAPQHRVEGRAEIHGTAIAGIIASAANNAEGIVGVAPDAAIVSLRACWTVDAISGQAECSSLSLAQALEAALGLGVDVINLSLAGPPDPLIARLIDAAVGAGIVVIAALPEVPDAADNFPASHPAVIAAGSALPGLAAITSALHAPANEVLSTIPDAQYAFFSGNSMASAFVAGVAALVLERDSLSGPDLRALLAETSTSESVNACRAVARLRQELACPAAIEPGITSREAQ